MVYWKSPSRTSAAMNTLIYLEKNIRRIYPALQYALKSLAI